MRFKHGPLMVLVIALFFSIYMASEAIADDSAGKLTEAARLGRGWIGGLSWTADG
ncbi:MAG: hypothetical protein IT323_15335, partial [Anaerolineae bacterium]|nr:hypothetical protein [Anaerolineae bacterium]